MAGAPAIGAWPRGGRCARQLLVIGYCLLVVIRVGTACVARHLRTLFLLSVSVCCERGENARPARCNHLPGAHLKYGVRRAPLSLPHLCVSVCNQNAEK